MLSSIYIALIGSAAAQWTAGKGAVAAQPIRQQSEPVYTCPLGFNLNGKTCEKPIQAPAQTICQQGYLQGDYCVLDTPKTTRCPAGTTQQGKQCVTNLQQPATRMCPPGYVDTGAGCEATEQLPLIEVCEIGSREGPQCVTLDAAPYNTNQYCPPGYEEHSKGGCWKSTIYDCTPLQSGKGGFTLRGLVGKEGGMSAPVNNPKVNVIQQTCERKESTPYLTDRNCPPGYTDTGANCVLKNYFPTSTRCSNGGPIEACYTTRNAGYQYECPFGTTMSGKNCLSTGTEPMESFCAIGFDNGVSCTQQFPPQTICPPGLQLSGTICLGSETTPPQVTVTVTCTGKNCQNTH